MLKMSDKEAWGCFCSIVFAALFATGVMAAMKSLGLVGWSWAAVLSPGWALLILTASSLVAGKLKLWGDENL